MLRLPEGVTVQRSASRGCAASPASPTRSPTTSPTRRALGSRTIPAGRTAAGVGAGAVELPRRQSASTRRRRGRICCADHRPGGQGVTVAVLDTGVAYRNWQTVPKGSPDFSEHPVRHALRLRRQQPRSRSIARATARSSPGPSRESTNNRRRSRPGSPTARRSCRCASSTPTAPATPRRSPRAFATPPTTARRSSTSASSSTSTSPRRDIPDILSAIRYAHRHGVVVVAASGNEGVEQIAYPARAPGRDLGRRDHQRSLPGRLLQRRQHGSISSPPAAATTPI